MTGIQIVARLCSMAMLFAGGVNAMILEETEFFEANKSSDAPRLLQECLEESGTPGAAIALFDHGKIQIYTLGRTTLEGNPIAENTLFELGSVTKVFTTLALMDRIEKGGAKLDDSIDEYLPETKIPEFNGHKITLRHLATHTSGIPRMPVDFAPEDPSNPYKDYTVENLYAYLQSLTLAKMPGEAFEYSNIGMGLLGHILTLQEGKSYADLIQELVQDKLNMANTSVGIADEDLRLFSWGHHMRQPVPYWDIPALAGAGALRSNIRDMAQFLAANMGASDSSLQTLLAKCHEKQFSPMSGFSVGLGWMVSCSNGQEIVWHNGGTGGFRSYIGMNRKLERGVVILSNSTEDWTDELGLSMLDPQYMRPNVDKILASSPEYLSKFTGCYEVVFSKDISRQTMQISVYGRLLASSLSGGEVGMLYPESYGVFGVKGFPDGKVYFSFDEAGNVSKVEARLISSGILLWQATHLLVQ